MQTDAGSKVEGCSREGTPLSELYLTAIGEKCCFVALVNYKHNQQLQSLLCASLGTCSTLMHAVGREQT